MAPKASLNVADEGEVQGNSIERKPSIQVMEEIVEQGKNLI